jgi:shikimate kinase
MHEARTLRNLALIGFMGTGKSTVGHVAAEVLGFSFVDTDHLIEARAGMSINTIFAEHGEAVFRKWESQVVSALASETRTVIATGGGLPALNGNLESLKQHALVVCLWASVDTIYERVRNHSHRPLLNEPDALSRIQHLLAAREPYYRKADVLVSTELRSVREVALQVVHQFHVAQVVH